MRDESGMTEGIDADRGEQAASPGNVAMQPTASAGVGSPAVGVAAATCEVLGAETPAGRAGAVLGLRHYYGYQLVSEVGLTSAIWVLYLRERGMSLGEIGLAEAVFHLAPITLELPTGSLADVLGQKWSLAIGDEGILPRARGEQEQGRTLA